MIPNLVHKRMKFPRIAILRPWSLNLFLVAFPALLVKMSIAIPVLFQSPSRIGTPMLIWTSNSQATYSQPPHAGSRMVHAVTEHIPAISKARSFDDIITTFYTSLCEDGPDTLLRRYNFLLEPGPRKPRHGGSLGTTETFPDVC